MFIPFSNNGKITSDKLFQLPHKNPRPPGLLFLAEENLPGSASVCNSCIKKTLSTMDNRSKTTFENDHSIHDILKRLDSITSTPLFQHNEILSPL